MRVAKTYTNWNYDETKAYEKGGKLYVDATCECDRCSKGVFVCRVENGQPVPHPAYGGVCLKCGGSGYLSKSIRLYTEKEFESIEKAVEKAAQKRHQAQEEKMQAEFAHKKEIWDKTNGFNEDGNTYIVLGNSYSIKDQLKEAGFRYNGMLKRWMKGEPSGIPQDYKGEVIKLHSSSLVEYSAWGEGHLLSEAKEVVDNIEKEMFPEEPSEWVGEIGKRMTFTVSLVRVHSFQNAYGISNVYNFKDEKGNELVWFSKVDLQKDPGDEFSIVGTVKDHSEYNGRHQTILTRCKLAK